MCRNGTRDTMAICCGSTWVAFAVRLLLRHFCLPVSQLKTVETPKECSRQLEDSVDYAKVVSCWPQLRITQMVTVSL